MAHQQRSEQRLRAGQGLLDAGGGFLVPSLAFDHQPTDLSEHEAKQRGDDGQDGQLEEEGFVHAASIASGGVRMTKCVKRA
jgi:hypothetical protein